MKNFVTTAIALMLGATALAADQVPWSEDFAAYNSISKWPSAKGISSTRSITQSSGQLYMAQAPTNKENGYYLWFTENGFDLEAGKAIVSILIPEPTQTPAPSILKSVFIRKGRRSPLSTMNIQSS